jgi:hypothetical protein
VNPVTRISPISDAEAGSMARAGTLAELAEMITSTSPAGGARRLRAAAPARRITRRRLILGLPIAAGLAAVAVVASSLAGPEIGGVRIGPPRAQAAVMSVTRHNGYLDVIVTNPLADASKYRQEFARLGLDIKLTLVPASPSLVGTLVYFEGGSAIKPITAAGKCWTGGGGYSCPVGVRVPVHYKGSAVLTFGRPAKPGEQYETTGLVTARGEAMHGMTFLDKTVAAVVAALAERHVTVGDYHFMTGRCIGVNRTHVPGSWYVTGADPWAPGQVALSVSRTLPVPGCNSQPAAGKQLPNPSPSPSGSAG